MNPSAHASSTPSSFSSAAVSRSDFDEVMVPTYAPSEVVPVRAEGAWIEDSLGRRHLDFTSGIAVIGLGHAHPAVLQALVRQSALLWHVGNGFTNEPVLRLAKALTALTFADRVFMTNSGAEANEAALKLARKYGSDKSGGTRRRIVSCEQSFHGRTLFTVSVGGQPKYTAGFEPLPGGISHVPFNDIAAAEAAIADDVCAVIVEPVQGEGGVIAADVNYLRALRRLCDAHGALLIFDEVQCGMGRSGQLFAYQHYGVVPDILTTAKSLGNGFPVGAMLTRDDIAAAFGPGSHGSTYGGNPLAAAVALAVVSTVSEPAFLARVRQSIDHLWAGLATLRADFPQLIAEVRGCGFMVGLVLGAAYRGRAKELTRLTERHQLLTLMAGPDVLRLLPPLVVTRAEIDEALDRLRRCAQEFTVQVAA